MSSNEDKLKQLEDMEFIVDLDGDQYEFGIQGILNELLLMNKSNYGKTVTVSLWKDFRPST